MVRGPTMSIFGCSIVPSDCSISVQGTPRHPSSPASASPTGPAPTIRIGVRSLMPARPRARDRRGEVALRLEHLPMGWNQCERQTRYPSPERGGWHRRPSAAVLGTKNADAKRRLCERSEAGRVGFPPPRLASLADPPPLRGGGISRG